MRRFVNVRRLFPICGTRWLTSGTQDKEQFDRLQQQINGIKSSLKTLEDSKLANDFVNLYASQRLTQMDIRAILVVFNDKSSHAPIFCHETLPIVLAHFITELDTLPAGLKEMPSILSVRATLLRSFQKLINCEIPVSSEQMKVFRRVLEGIDEDHAQCDLLQTMAYGVLELKEYLSSHRRALLELKTTSKRWESLPITESQVLPYRELLTIQEPLDRVNRAMITYNCISRMLLNCDTDEIMSGEKRSRIGMVDLEINLESVVRGAVHEAKQICTDHYGDCPDTEFIITSESKMFKFPFMSTTIRYIILELMKNAFRATVESHMKRNSLGIVTCDDMPPVRVLINLQEGIEHACICISDEGKGMTEEALKMAMAYSYTSVNKPALSLKTGRGNVTEASPLAGYGYGLPMSRVYAQSLGGDLVMQTMEGYGTRAYYYIKIA